MTREQVEDWIRRYERAWRSPGTAHLAAALREGRWAHFEEWAYWPDRPYTAPRS